MRNEVVMITGASRGIGRSIAHAFAREGAHLLLISRDSKGLEGVAQEARHYGVGVVLHACDVTMKGKIEGAVSKALKEFGKVDVLVNSAGVVGPIGPLVDNDLHAWLRAVQVNLWGTAICMQTVLRHMIGRRKGSIINLSGGGAVTPRPRFSAYSAAKAAVVRLTETVAEEVKEHRIRVNAIAPGVVATSMLDEILAAGERAGKETEELQRHMQTGGSSPEKVADLALFLASPAAEGISGRLLSAVWDDWRSLPAQVKALRGSSMFTLRRIDGRRFTENG